MKKHSSFRKKLITLCVLSLLMMAILLDGVSLYFMYKLSMEDAEQVIINIDESNVEKLNTTLDGIAHSASLLYAVVYRELGDDPTALEDDEFRADYCRKVDYMAYRVAEMTEEVSTVYVVFDQYATYYDDMIYYVRDGNNFVSSKKDPISDYDASDFENVGWYYETIAAGKAGWIRPCYHSSLKDTIFSYTIPIYVDHVFVGIVGMDISVSFLQDIVSQMNAYETGYGVLLSPNYDIVYHPQYPDGLPYGEMDEKMQEMLSTLDSNQYVTNIHLMSGSFGRYWVANRTLTNGMILEMIVDVSEITEPMWVMFRREVVVTFVVLVATLIGVTQFIKGIIKPLNELSDSAIRLGKSDMDVQIKDYDMEEFSNLSQAFVFMRDKLKESFEYMSGLAYSDIMTGANNKGAFEKDSVGIANTCKKSGEQFAVIVIDVNNLKLVNDMYGHMEGDELIKVVAKKLMEVFGKRNTYRVGGDEFCVLLRENNELRLKDDINAFRDELTTYYQNNKDLFHDEISVAVGYSLFDPNEDDSFNEVYRRADSRMYENKKEIKESINMCKL